MYVVQQLLYLVTILVVRCHCTASSVISRVQQLLYVVTILVVRCHCTASTVISRVQQLLYVVTILVVCCYCTAAMLYHECNNYCILLQCLYTEPQNCFPWIATSIFVRDLWNVSHRMRLGILHRNMWKKFFCQKSSYDSCTLGQQYVRSKHLFVQNICSFKKFFRSKHLFVQNICSFKTYVRSKHLFVRNLYSFKCSTSN